MFDMIPRQGFPATSPVASLVPVILARTTAADFLSHGSFCFVMVLQVPTLFEVISRPTFGQFRNYFPVFAFSFLKQLAIPNLFLKSLFHSHRKLTKFRQCNGTECCKGNIPSAVFPLDGISTKRKGSALDMFIEFLKVPLLAF